MSQLDLHTRHYDFQHVCRCRFGPVDKTGLVYCLEPYIE